jgi:hypothetical protein
MWAILLQKFFTLLDIFSVKPDQLPKSRISPKFFHGVHGLGQEHKYEPADPSSQEISPRRTSKTCCAGQETTSPFSKVLVFWPSLSAKLQNYLQPAQCTPKISFLNLKMRETHYACKTKQRYLGGNRRHHLRGRS